MNHQPTRKIRVHPTLLLAICLTPTTALSGLVHPDQAREVKISIERTAKKAGPPVVFELPKGCDYIFQSPLAQPTNDPGKGLALGKQKDSWPNPPAEPGPAKPPIAQPGKTPPGLPADPQPGTGGGVIIIGEPPLPIQPPIFTPPPGGGLIGTPTPVPLPAAAWLLATGLMGLGLATRMRRPH